MRYFAPALILVFALATPCAAQELLDPFAEIAPAAVKALQAEAEAYQAEAEAYQAEAEAYQAEAEAWDNEYLARRKNKTIDVTHQQAKLSRNTDRTRAAAAVAAAELWDTEPISPGTWFRKLRYDDAAASKRGPAVSVSTSLTEPYPAAVAAMNPERKHREAKANASRARKYVLLAQKERLRRSGGARTGSAGARTGSGGARTGRGGARTATTASNEAN